MKHISTKKSEIIHLVELTTSECRMLACILYDLDRHHNFYAAYPHTTYMGFNVNEYREQFAKLADLL